MHKNYCSKKGKKKYQINYVNYVLVLSPLAVPTLRKGGISLSDLIIHTLVRGSPAPFRSSLSHADIKELSFRNTHRGLQRSPIHM